MSTVNDSQKRNSQGASNPEELILEHEQQDPPQEQDDDVQMAGKPVPAGKNGVAYNKTNTTT